MQFESKQRIVLMLQENPKLICIEAQMKDGRFFADFDTDFAEGEYTLICEEVFNATQIDNEIKIGAVCPLIQQSFCPKNPFRIERALKVLDIVKKSKT